MTLRVLAATLSLVLLAVCTAKAQSSEVAVEIAVTATTTITPPSEPDPDPAPLDPTTDNVITPGGPGSYVRTVEYNTDVTVSFVASPMLVAGQAEVPVTLTCAYRLDEGGYSEAVSCSEASWGEGIFDVGATAAARDIAVGYTILAADLVGKPAGTYAGTVTVTVVPR